MNAQIKTQYNNCTATCFYCNKTKDLHFDKCIEEMVCLDCSPLEAPLKPVSLCSDCRVNDAMPGKAKCVGCR